MLLCLPASWGQQMEVKEISSLLYSRLQSAVESSFATIKRAPCKPWVTSDSMCFILQLQQLRHIRRRALP
eukprot:12933367-Prorocentrum_lima.AAC.1